MMTAGESEGMVRKQHLRGTLICEPGGKEKVLWPQVQRDTAISGEKNGSARLGEPVGKEICAELGIGQRSGRNCR